MSSEFVFEYPLRVVGKDTSIGNFSPIVGYLNDGEMVLFFTDDDLANDCTEQFPGSRIEMIETAERLIKILDELPASIVYVGFDPPKAATITKADLLYSLRSKNDI